MHTWTQTHAHTHTWPHTQVRHVIFQLWQHVRTPVQSPGGQGGGGGKEKISNPVATGPRGSVGARAGRGGGGEKGGGGGRGGEEGEDHAVAIDLLLGMGFSRAQVPYVCVCARARECACVRARACVRVRACACVCAYCCCKTCNKQFRRSVRNTSRNTLLGCVLVCRRSTRYTAPLSTRRLLLSFC
jgi:hypothetical protein